MTESRQWATRGESGPSVSNLKEQPVEEAAERESRAARELAAIVQEIQANCEMVLERLAEATRRGLDDARGPSGGGSEPVGGTKDYTQQMLDRLGGGGSRKLRDDQGNEVGEVAIPLEQDDPSRKSLAMLTASLGAARDWTGRAKHEMFSLLPLERGSARFLLGQGPAICKNNNCGREVWCTPRDRLISGRCEACAKYWDRHDRNEERPASLCRPSKEKQRVNPAE